MLQLKFNSILLILILSFSFNNIVMGQQNIFHIPPPAPFLGDTAIFQVNTINDFEVVGAFFLYRQYGQQSYNQVEMNYSGDVWEGVILGVDNLVEMFEEKYYRNLNGGIMEAFGIIFTRDVKFFLYPYKPDEKTELLNSNNIPIHPRVKDLYNYLHSNGRVKDLNYNADILGIFSKDILKKIKSKEKEKWEHAVPKGVAKIIKEKKLFIT